MQREILSFVCDGCGKVRDIPLTDNGEDEFSLAGNVPIGWRALQMTSNTKPFENIDFDVCSPGCAENAVIKIIREKIYD